MSKHSIKNVLENLFLMFGREKTQNRAKTHRPSMSAFSAIFVLKENGTGDGTPSYLSVLSSDLCKERSFVNDISNRSI